MYQTYIVASYIATFVPLIILALASLRAHRAAQDGVRALEDEG